jgi:hypothetical protein
MAQNMYTTTEYPSDTTDSTSCSSPLNSSLPRHPPPETFEHIFATQKKKYKPVAQKVCPIPTTLPNKYHIVRNISGDPLENMPTLDPNPPPFTPTARYTEERRAALDKEHPDFLQPAERDLMHDFMCKQDAGFAWTDSERGYFHTTSSLLSISPQSRTSPGLRRTSLSLQESTKKFVKSFAER